MYIETADGKKPLNNVITILLVSNKAIKSLTAVARSVGLPESPHNQLSLANFLEHMVLMGSRHYPELENLLNFLKKHGGDHSASTRPTERPFIAIQPDIYRLTDAIDIGADPMVDRNGRVFAIAAFLFDKGYVQCYL